MEKCIYPDCTFEAEIEAEVQNHIYYMTHIVGDPDHDPSKLKPALGPDHFMDPDTGYSPSEDWD